MERAQTFGSEYLKQKLETSESQRLLSLAMALLGFQAERGLCCNEGCKPLAGTRSPEPPPAVVFC